MSKIRFSQTIAESESIKALRYEYIEDKPQLKIYEKETYVIIKSIPSKGIENDLNYVLEKYPSAVSCLDEE